MNLGCVFPYARQCAATSKRTGNRCRAPAEVGKNVCRFHGARAGAPRGERNGQYKHGLCSKESIQARKQLRALLKQVTATVREVE